MLMRRCSRNSRDLGVVIGAASCPSVLHTLGYWAQKKKPAISPLSSRAPCEDLTTLNLESKGRMRYFNSDRSGKWEIWRIPAEGGGPGDAKAQQVTGDDLENWFPHLSPNGKWMLVFSFPKVTKTHNEKLEGVDLRLAPSPGKKLKPVK